MDACRISEKFDWIECQLPIRPSDPEGFCILHSQDKDKDQAAFNAALKEKLEREDYDFMAVFFPGPVFFGGHEFTKDAYFSWASFSGKSNFFRAAFSGRANFFRVAFSGRADFSWAAFSGRAVFFRAAFSGRAVFKRTTFSATEASDFRQLDLKERGALRFQDLSLGQVQFKDTDLRLLEFRHVDWHRFRGRQAIYDEIRLRAKEKERPGTWFSGPDIAPHLAAAPPSPLHGLEDEYAEVERLYRNLKINYEAEGDYKNAGDFHYGEMEMHRRATKWRWFPFYWYNLYRFLSGYGERPSWALGWLALFLFGLAGLLWGLDLKIVDSQQLAGFGDSFIYILQKATLQRPEWANSVTFGGNLFAALSVLLLPGQAALFLLALRNRLGRRR